LRRTFPELVAFNDHIFRRDVPHEFLYEKYNEAKISLRG